MPIPAKFSIVEVEQAISELKTAFEDAKKAYSGWINLEPHLPRIAYLLTTRPLLQHINSKELPFADVNNLLPVAGELRLYEKPLAWPLDPRRRLAMQVAVIIAMTRDEI